ncbi:MAG: DUF1501 domain-containing protein, partial [Verrucomicrobiae bacterium]|nr:DUF1501 domain-containing protein [Verrucomicrobiae bacterium]
QLTRAASPERVAKAKSVIFLFQWGGPSHIDTFDMKPDAPDDYRSPHQGIPTSLPGLHINEHLPRVAEWMDRVTLVRSLTHKMNNHNSAGYYALSGHAPTTDDQRLRDSLDLYPAYGSVIDYLAPNANGMPTFVAFPHVVSDGSITPGQHASFLGKAHDPLFFQEDPNQKDFQLPELSLPANLPLERLHRRREIQQLIDRQSGLLEQSLAASGLDDYYTRAVTMLTSEKVRQAFNLTAEPESTREKYGWTTYGQSCLLARRLVESGVKVVTVYFSSSIGGRKIGEGGWDTHGFDNTRMYKIVDQYHYPITDQTLPTLLGELDERGLLDSTLVLWMGEFGRTPKINQNVGRDHYPQAFSGVLAGGGIVGGRKWGKTDATGENVVEDAVSVFDFNATIAYALGLPLDQVLYSPSKRPFTVAAKGQPVVGMFS